MFVVIIRRPPRSTVSGQLLAKATLCRSEGVDRGGGMVGGQREAAVGAVGGRGAVGDGGEACARPLLQPLRRLALGDAGAGGQLGRRRGAVSVEGVVEAELASEVDGEELERAGGGGAESLGQIHGATLLFGAV